MALSRPLSHISPISLPLSAIRAHSLPKWRDWRRKLQRLLQWRPQQERTGHPPRMKKREASATRGILQYTFQCMHHNLTRSCMGRATVRSLPRPGEAGCQPRSCVTSPCASSQKRSAKVMIKVPCLNMPPRSSLLAVLARSSLLSVEHACLCTPAR